MTLKIGIISGYFNPLHVGHLDLIEKSLEKVDVLYAIINSDLQIGSENPKNQSERSRIVSSIKRVSGTFISIDKDNSVCKTIEELYHFIQYHYRESRDDMKIYFIKGGNKKNSRIPEYQVCSRLGIEILDELTY